MIFYTKKNAFIETQNVDFVFNLDVLTVCKAQKKLTYFDYI